ncbi:proteasome accessory factor PafA2 family protein [Cellulomonas palmilytica]|uniref:proteasome accessory factor PafA2 family protein n=1 Tax=Cellulomonas palmilytica TaxID=2608402 RepID=UPI00294FEFEF|nr:proteasome accessory factor PafA2 family protein [Cellulomonas palmilytica]
MTYATPEVTGPLDAVRWHRAGAMVIPGAVGDRAHATDEFYEVAPRVPVGRIRHLLRPHLTTRRAIGVGTPSVTIRSRGTVLVVEEHAEGRASDRGTFLRVGTTSLVLAMIEDGYLVERIDETDARAAQARFRELAGRYLDRRFGDDADPDARAVLEYWSLALSGEVVEEDPLAALVASRDVALAAVAPPADTRAYFRGECIRRFGAVVTSWDAIHVRDRSILMRDHLGWGRSRMGSVLEACEDVDDLLAAFAPGRRP